MAPPAALRRNNMCTSPRAPPQAPHPGRPPAAATALAAPAVEAATLAAAAFIAAPAIAVSAIGITAAIRWHLSPPPIPEHQDTTKLRPAS